MMRTFRLANQELDNIINHLKKRDDADLNRLITSLNESRKNYDQDYTSISKVQKNDDKNCQNEKYWGYDRPLPQRSAMWEGGEHDDSDVEVPVPHLAKIERKEKAEKERKEADRRRREREEREMREMRQKMEGQRMVGEFAATFFANVFNVGGLGIPGALGLIDSDVLEGRNISRSFTDGEEISRRFNRTRGLYPRLDTNSYFESGEHDDEEVLTILKNNILTLPNGIQLTYGEIIAFAGDFYGIPDIPICQEQDGSTWETRFVSAFNTLGRGDANTIRKELKQIKEILAIEKNSVATVMGKGDPSIPTVLEKDKTYTQPSDVYKYHGLWFTIQYDTILGGTWVGGTPIIFGRMMKLAANNPDHFQPYSREVWRVGHRIALRKAQEARSVYRLRRKDGVRLLQEAYAISAFSCHFLTDSFAAGHIRVPRVELPKVVTPAIEGDLLVHYHHDEDGKFGINVINEDGQRWRCFGDGTLYDNKSKENKKRVRAVVQECVNQVWKVFRGDNKNGDENKILRKIPKVDTTRSNNYPLFKAVTVDGTMKVLRREDVNDLSDYRTKDNWWGWSTLYLLNGYDPKNSVVDSD